MANLDELARGVPADDIKSVDLPSGQWRVKLKSGKFRDEAFSEKIGAYLKAVIVAVPVMPVEGVDPEELEAFLEAGGYEEATIFHEEGPLYRKRDFEGLTKRLKKVGVPSAGRNLEEMLDEIDDQDAIIEVSYKRDENKLDDDGKPRVYTRTKMFKVPDSNDE